MLKNILRYSATQRIAIYPADSYIRPLNNWGLIGELSASSPVVPGEFGCDVTRQACRESSEKSEKIIVICDRINMIRRQVTEIMLLRLSKKENILVINNGNITKLTKTVYPEYYWVTSFMVYAFYMVNVSSITCI